MRKILVLDDEMGARLLLADFLIREGFEVQTVASLSEFDEARKSPFDLIIMDRMIDTGHGAPKDALEHLRRLRGANMTTPVLVVSGQRTEDAHELESLQQALCFMRKPLRLSILLQNVRNLLAVGTVVQTKGRWSVNSDALTVTVDGTRVALNPAEFKFFMLLFEAYRHDYPHPCALSYRRLNAELYADKGDDPVNLRARHSVLRKQFQAAGHSGPLIGTRRKSETASGGYYLEH